MKIFKDHAPDFSAGFSVALVALPLSIGIALASGAPPSAGLIAAIIGGIIGSWLGGSHVTINGPAAGLIVIVLDAITALGKGDALAGFKGMLAASVVAGGLQIAFGLLKLGRKGSAFPTSVVHGMMAAIGLTIIAKQLHVMIGHTPVAKKPLMLYAEIPTAIMDIKPMIFASGLIALTILFGLSKAKVDWVKKLPAPLLAIFAGSIFASFVGVGGNALLQIPTNFSEWLIFPDFSVMATLAGWKAAITLALVGSLETVLSAKAVDKIDPLKRDSNLDRDLMSKGVCNLASAAIGGLPMIAEIVRSSANVSYGARSWRANFIHGGILLALVLIFPKLLAFIPLASLAAILVMVGSRLGGPVHWFHAVQIGKDNAVGFFVTLLVTLSVDLLVGIFAGTVAQFAVEIFLGLRVKNLVHAEFHSHDEVKYFEMDVESSLGCSNFLPIKDVINDHLAQKQNVVIDISHCDYVDHSVMEELHDLQKNFVDFGLELKVVKSPKHVALGHDVTSAIKKAS